MGGPPLQDVGDGGTEVGEYQAREEQGEDELDEEPEGGLGGGGLGGLFGSLKGPELGQSTPSRGASVMAAPL